ncbi:monocarboxylate transporter 13-like [Glandiceps talaboti]
MPHLRRAGCKRPQAPPDGGWGWLIVVAHFISVFLHQGMSSTMPVIYVELLNYFGQGAAATSWILALRRASGYCTAPLTSILCKKFGFRGVAMAGGVLSAVSFLVSSFATSIVYLCFSCGLVAGFSLSLSAFPTSISLGRFFKKRYALANGIAVTASGIGGFAMPILCQHLINYYGWRGTLIVISALSANFCVAASLLRPLHLKSDVDLTEARSEAPPNIRECTELSENEIHQMEETSDRMRRSNLKEKASKIMCFFIPVFKARPVAVLLMMYCFAYGFGLNIILGHYVDNAVKNRTGEEDAAFLVSIIGILTCVSCLVTGIVSSCANADVGIVNSHCFGVAVFGVVSVFIPFASSFESLVGISVTIGLSRGIFSALDEVMIKQVVGESTFTEGMGISTMFVGIGALLGPPFSGYLYDYTGSYNTSFHCAGLVLICGSSLLPLAWLYTKIKNKCTHVTSNSTAACSGAANEAVPGPVEI